MTQHNFHSLWGVFCNFKIQVCNFKIHCCFLITHITHACIHLLHNLNNTDIQSTSCESLPPLCLYFSCLPRGTRAKTKLCIFSDAVSHMYLDMHLYVHTHRVYGPHPAEWETWGDINDVGGRKKTISSTWSSDLSSNCTVLNGVSLLCWGALS